VRHLLKEALFNEFKNSIKSPDTEEKLDLIIYRPFGFLIAKIANVLNMTPTMLSLIGLYFGLLASFTYFGDHTYLSLSLAGFYLVLSGIFDSADGQLARISNQSTKIGLILDGICDSIVTIAVYFACAWPFVELFGYLFVAVILISLSLHSYQCAILDFYHREYLYFGYGKTENDTYWNPSISDGIQNIKNSTSRLEKLMNQLRLTWIKKQQFLSSRTDNERMAMRDYLLSSDAESKKEFTELYRKNNLQLLPFWRLIGVNAHTVLIIVFMFIGRFDLYMIAFDLVIFNLVILIVGLMQKRMDKNFQMQVQLHEK
jgi:hypothetical protein